MAADSIRQRRAEAVCAIDRARPCASNEFRFQGWWWIRRRASRMQPLDADRIRGPFSAARPRRGQQSGIEAGGCYGPERVAPCDKRPAASGAMETNEDQQPGDRLCLGPVEWTWYRAARVH